MLPIVMDTFLSGFTLMISILDGIKGNTYKSPWSELKQTARLCNVETFFANKAMFFAVFIEQRIGMVEMYEINLCFFLFW